MFVRMKPEDRTLKCSRGYDMSSKKEIALFCKNLFSWCLAHMRVGTNGKLDCPPFKLEFSQDGWGAF